MAGKAYSVQPRGGAVAAGALARFDARLAVLVLSALAAGLRLSQLDAQSLWIDEVLSVRAASGSLWQVVFDPLENTRIPPLYYVLLRPFADRAAYPEFWLRLPSAVFGVLCVPLMWAVARRLCGAPVALIACALLALSPFHLWYSQEARPYALMLCLSLASFYCLARLDRPGLARCALAAASTAALLLSHLVAVFILPFFLLWAAVGVPPAQRRRVLAALALALGALALGLWLVSSYDLQNPAAPKAAGASAWLYLPYTFWAFVGGFSAGPSLSELHAGSPWPALRQWGWQIALLAAPVAAAAFALLRRLPSLWPRAWVALAWCVLPIAAALAAALLVPGESYNVRYAIVAWPGFVIALALGVHSLRPPPLRATALLWLAATQLFALWQLHADPRYAREDNRGAGAVLAARAQPGDVVVADAPYSISSLRHYGPEGLDYQRAGDSAYARLRVLAERGEGRVWLYRCRDFHGDPRHREAALLETRARRLDHWRGPQVVLRLYTFNPAR